MTRVPTMVFSGEFWTGASALGLANGFRQLGWAVQDIDLGRYVPALGRDVMSRAARRLLSPLAKRAFRAAVLDACATLKPDVFLSIKGTLITADLLRRIKETGARTALFYPDFHFDHPYVPADSLELYDKVITTKTFQVPYLSERLGAGKVAYVPHGYSSGVHRPLLAAITEEAYTADLLHAGIFSPYKMKWLSEVRLLHPDKQLRIIGDGWEKAAGGGPLQPCIHGKARFGAAYAQAIQTARINIAIHHGPSASGWQDNVSTRTFEIPACGGFMLHIDNDEVREFYKVGEEIDVFSTPGELADKIQFYLARPALRAAMIERAYRRCVPAYSYDARAAEIERLLVCHDR